jgi:hypothetical protein
MARFHNEREIERALGNVDGYKKELCGEEGAGTDTTTEDQCIGDPSIGLS